MLTGRAGHVQPVPSASESDLYASMRKSFVDQMLRDSEHRQQIDGSLLEDPRTYAGHHVIAGLAFQDDILNAVMVEKLPEHEAGGSAADDGYLGSQEFLLLLRSQHNEDT
jgi:hypothetical protein